MAMKVSTRPVFNGGTLEIGPQVLGQRRDLAEYIGPIIATWADIEARLDAIYLLMTRDEEGLEEFQSLKGWDRRVQFIESAVEQASGRDRKLVVRAVLKEVASAAQRRHEIAHGIWAVSDAHPDALILLPGNFLIPPLRTAIEAEVRGELRSTHPSDPAAVGCVVEQSDLQRLIDDLRKAQWLIHRFQIEHMPGTIEICGRDKLEAVEGDVGVAARLKVMRRQKAPPKRG